MKKTWIRTVFLLLLALLLVPTAYADTEAADASDEPAEYYRAIDAADLLTESQLQSLNELLDSISERYGTNVCVMTIDSLEGYTAEEVADYYLEELYNNEGILLLVSMGERKWHMSTGGDGIRLFTDYGLECLEDKFIDALSAGYYYDAFTDFGRGAEEYLRFEAQNDHAFDVWDAPKDPYNPILCIVISLVVGLIGAAIYTGKLKSELKPVRFQPGAGAYVRDGSFQLTASNDMFLYRNVTRTVRESSSSGRGGSSTHTSSGGHSHGGRGGSF